jgi:hypothetical protein
MIILYRPVPIIYRGNGTISLGSRQVGIDIGYTALYEAIQGYTGLYGTVWDIIGAIWDMIRLIVFK